MRKWRAGEKTAKDNGLSHLIETLEWCDIPGFPGYKASKCGQILSTGRIVERDNGRPYTVPEMVLKQTPDSKDRLQVGIYLDKKRTAQFVHKLVYLTYKGAIPKGHDIDHIDQDHRNNHIDNLQCLTRKEHALKTLSAMKQKAYDAGYRQALIDHGIITTKE
jgi:hypothetical protein